MPMNFKHSISQISWYLLHHHNGHEGKEAPHAQLKTLQFTGQGVQSFSWPHGGTAASQ